MKIFRSIADVLGWLQIAATPFLLSLLISGIVYMKMPDSTGLAIGFVICGLGLAGGVLWATRVRKQRGSLDFLSDGADKKDGTGK